MQTTLRNDIADRLRLRTIIFLTCSCFGIASCVSVPTISTETSYCCRPSAEQIHTFRIEFEDMPEFLKPMLRDEASNVLHTKNLEYTEGPAHAVLKMTYADGPFVEPDAARNEDGQSNAAGNSMRFIAEVQLELTNTVTKELILAGSMSRPHDVYEGSYMHEAPARAAMRRAFADLFADLPDPIFDEY